MIFCLVLILGCSKDDIGPQKLKISDLDKQASVSGKWSGVSRVRGVGFYGTPDVCNPASQGATYSVIMTGDLEGCLYAFVDEFKCLGNGYYFEKGREYFVGTYKGKSGTFRTTYNFEAKFEGCNGDGTPAGLEIFGLCQHPLVEGSGQGVFKGATGRLDFVDNVKATPINFPYIGTLKF